MFTQGPLRYVLFNFCCSYLVDLYFESTRDLVHKSPPLQSYPSDDVRMQNIFRGSGDKHRTQASGI